MQIKKTLIIVVGPTASGKSELAVRIAKQVNGEIISADSRQIYRGLDIGSGKVLGKWVKLASSKDAGKNAANKKVFLYKGIPHYLIDEASPRAQFSVARFQKNAQRAISDIFNRGKTPIICGGTGHWIDAVVFGQTLPKVKPDAKLRAKLTKLSTAQMFAKLQKLDPDRAAKIDAKNPRRLIRALEIVLTTGEPVPKLKANQNQLIKKNPGLRVLWLGLSPDQKILERKIKTRLQKRIKLGMVDEVAKLHQPKAGVGLSWKKLESFGLEYKYCALYLQGKISKVEMEKLAYTAIRQYAKRQMTWWKRNHEITWLKNGSLPKLST